MKTPFGYTKWFASRVDYDRAGRPTRRTTGIDRPEYLVLGRNYINVVSAEDDSIEQVVPKKFGFFFTFSRITCQHQHFLVYAPPETLPVVVTPLPVGSVATIVAAVDPDARSLTEQFAM